MTTPALPPPELLHVERDNSEVYITVSEGLERLCTMSRDREAQRIADAKMIVRACNQRTAMVESLRGLVAIVGKCEINGRLIEHDYDVYAAARQLLEEAQ